MAFLAMTVSIFSVVANIADNLNNNNNNNQNDNNLNYVHQQNNNLNMNQNIVNQLNIDLPPPVPGRKRRTVPEKLEYNNKIREMMNMSRTESVSGCSGQDVTMVASKAML